VASALIYAKTVKPVLDLVVAAALLVVLCIPMTLIALIVRFTSPGPALFRQTRVGRNGVPFKIYKFRTMRVGTPHARRLTDPDAYITPIGHVLRRTSLDELPQLINILRGEMSIVGPRPVLYTETATIADRKANGASRLRPGVTGWAQVNGRDLISETRRAQFDGEYFQTIGWHRDLQCLAMTLATVLSGEGNDDHHQPDGDPQHCSPSSGRPPAAQSGTSSLCVPPDVR